MKVSLLTAIRMSIVLYAQGNGPYWKVLRHCLWSRERGNELVDQGYSPEEIIEKLLEEEKNEM